MTNPPPEKNKNLFIAISLIISLGVSLVVAEWVLSYQRQVFTKMISGSEKMEPGMILYDAKLGWKLSPYWSGKHQHYDYDVQYNINRKGFRAPAVTLENTNYAIVGDSFSFGLGVNDEETFTAILNASATQKNNFYNFSVPGYSTDQQLLLIDNVKHQISKNVLLVVFLGNDVFDNMRSYPLQAGHGKPFFKLLNGNLQLQNTPVPLTPKPAAVQKETISQVVLGDTVGVNTFSGWFSRLEINQRLGLFQVKPFLTEQEMEKRFSESLDLLYALIFEIEKLLKENNAKLTVVLLPGRSFVEQPESLSAQYQEYFRHNIKLAIETPGTIEVLDFAKQLQALNASGVTQLYHPNEGHLTLLGHQYMAAYLATQLAVELNTNIIPQ